MRKFSFLQIMPFIIFFTTNNKYSYSFVKIIIFNINYSEIVVSSAAKAIAPIISLISLEAHSYVLLL